MMLFKRSASLAPSSAASAPNSDTSLFRWGVAGETGAATAGAASAFNGELDYATPAAKPKVLVLCTVFNLAYRTVRCAHAAGADVYVLGNCGAKAFRFSRYCKEFVLSAAIIHGERDEDLAREVNCLVREFGITTIAAGCADALRTLITTQDLFEAPCFPMPTLEQFETLNNKWAFGQLCNELGVQYPESRLFPSAEAFAEELAAGKLQYPLIAKPVDWSGGWIGQRKGGVIVFDGSDTESDLKAICYAPVLVQKFLKGTEIGAALYARNGKIEAVVVHSLLRAVYATFNHDKVVADLAKIVARLGLNGVYNFDMMLEPDQSVTFLECNPRFYFRLNMTMLCGINFVALGLYEKESQGVLTIPDGVKVRMPKALVAAFPWVHCTRRDLQMFWYHFSDPLPFLLENLDLTV